LNIVSASYQLWLITNVCWSVCTQELLPLHSQQLPSEEAGGAAVDGLPHGDHHVRGPPHALPLQRRPHRLLQLLLKNQNYIYIYIYIFLLANKPASPTGVCKESRSQKDRHITCLSSVFEITTHWTLTRNVQYDVDDRSVGELCAVVVH
jgi:hypothetical protein